MERKLLAALLAALLLAAPAARPQSYKKLWREAQRAEADGLPRTALRAVERVAEKAAGDPAARQQRVKALMRAARLRAEISPDSLWAGIPRLEAGRAALQGTPEGAWLAYALGSLYGQAARATRAPASAAPAAEPPADPRQWQPVHFHRRAYECYMAAADPANYPGNPLASRYEALLEIPEGGLPPGATLRQILTLQAARALSGLAPALEAHHRQARVAPGDPCWTHPGDTLKALSPYDAAAAAANLCARTAALCLAQGDTLAAALARMEQLDVMRSRASFPAHGEEVPGTPYYAALAKLREDCRGNEAQAEVALQMARQLRSANRPAEAMALLRQAVEAHPRYFRADALRNEMDDIARPLCEARLPETACPDSVLAVMFRYKNSPQALVRLYRLDLPATHPGAARWRRLAATPYDAAPGEVQAFLRRHGTLVCTDTARFRPTPDYLPRDTTFRFAAPAAGLYMAEVSALGGDAAPAYALLHVSRLRPVWTSLGGGKEGWAVLDAQTGRPVPGATLRFFRSTGDTLSLVKALPADAQGELEWQPVDYHYAQAVCAGDSCMEPVRVWGSSGAVPVPARPEEHLTLYADRSLYRPGQAVHVAGTAWRQWGDSLRVQPGRRFTLRLLDANGREIGSREAVSDDFGVFAVQFMLPASCLPGRFTVDAGASRLSFRVEEYRRPTFRVAFRPVSAAYAAGDSVWLEGQAETFTGLPVADAQVAYTVRRSSGLWRGAGGSVVAAGTVLADDGGVFRIPVLLEAGTGGVLPRTYYQAFSVEAAATSPAGETQAATAWIPVGSSSVRLSASLGAEVVKERLDSLSFQIENLYGQALPGAEGCWRVLPGEGGRLPKDSCLLQGAFHSGQKTDVAPLRALPSGAYRLLLSAVDSLGREAEWEQAFTLFSLGDRRPPVRSALWLHQEGSGFGPGRQADLYLGTSLEDAYVLYNVYASGGQCIERRRIHLTDSIVKLSFGESEAYGDGVCVSCLLVRDGEVHQRVATVLRAEPDMRLAVRWSSFRDRLTPGQQEEWRLAVAYPDGRPARANLMAVLFDASLDALSPHRWWPGISFGRNVPYVSWQSAWPGSAYRALVFPAACRDVPAFAGASVRVEDFSQVLYGQWAMDGVYLLASSSRAVNAAMKAAPAVAEDMAAEEAAVEVSATGGGAAPAESLPGLRSDFAETAFFYPQLRTDAKGEAVVSFTLPESTTEWRWMGLAHTQDLHWALTDTTVVARKEFMAVPNMPRFLRAGDDAVLAATLANLTEGALQGTARIEVFDPVTERVLFSARKAFRVAGNASDSISFAFRAAFEPGLVACRIWAESDTGAFSDGEQHYLPVLSPKRWMTEAVPMSVTGTDTVRYALQGLFNGDSPTAVHRRLTVELAADPVWFAIQALPSLGAPADDNALSWVSAYYADNLSAHILNASPKIKAVFEAWRAQGGTGASLAGRLDGDASLRELLLEETPWLSAAGDEAEARQRLALLFDLNYLQGQNALATRKLAALQCADGAWPWFRGMQGSLHVTLYAVEALGRLAALTGQALPDDVLPMYRRAMACLHREACDYYSILEAAESRQGKDAPAQPSVLPSWVLRYLYACALSPVPLPEEAREAHDGFLRRLEAAGSVSGLYEKVLAAVVLADAGRREAAEGCLRSLAEYAVRVPGKGMWYDTRRAACSPDSYRVPVQVAVIEAFRRVGGHEADVEEMLLWLLSQKRVQAWDSPLSTVNAVYALMADGTALEGSSVALRMGSTEVTALSAASPSGSGYVKASFSEGDMPDFSQDAVLSKEGGGLAWGAVYAQYLEDMERVPSLRAEGFTVEKQLFVERAEGGRKVLLPVTDGTVLRVGEKACVRIVVAVGQDMDFVSLKDERPACLEPLSARSGYRVLSGTGCYEAVKDAATVYYFDRLPKGVYVFDTSYYVARAGRYVSGLSVLQSTYAPEYSAYAPVQAFTVE